MGKYSDQIATLDAPARKSKYADAIGALEKPPNTSNVEQEKDAYYSPSEIVKRAAVGATQVLPFAAPLMNVAQGRDAYEGSAVDQGAGMLGDVSNAALTALTAGRGLGAGAALNATLEGSGINEGMRKAASAVEDAYDPQTSSVGLNMALRTPQTAISALITAIPAILASNKKLQARAAEIAPSMPAPIAKLLAPKPIDSNVANRANFAQAHGIPLTMGETMGETSPAALREAGFRRSAGGERAALDMQAKQQTAIRENLAMRAESMGDDTLAGEIRQGGMMTDGRQLADVPEEAVALRRERGQAVGAAKKALAQEIPIRSNFAKELRGEMKATLATLKNAPAGSDRAKVQGIVADFLEPANGVKTMGGAIQFLDDFDSAIESSFARKAPSVQKAHLAGLRAKIRGVLDEAGDGLAADEQAALKVANKGFADIADSTDSLRDLEGTNPASILRSITTGKRSLSQVQGLHKVFPEGTPQHEGLKQAILQDVIKKATKKEGISGAGLKKALDSMDQDTLREIFKSAPGQLADFRKLATGLEDIETQRTPLGTVPSGNSHTATLARIISGATNVPFVPEALAAITGMRAKRAFKPFNLNAPKKTTKPLPQLQSIEKRFGINPVLLSRQLKATVQGQ